MLGSISTTRHTSAISPPYLPHISTISPHISQVASFLSLARALFGDFDIDEIMNNSSGYTNAVLFLVYLFVAVFILLSMFLAILGESQAQVRIQEEDLVRVRVGELASASRAAACASPRMARNIESRMKTAMNR